MPDKPPIRLHNKPALTSRRRKLRHRLTPAEAALWNVLKGSKLDGRKFRRQHSVGSFILDFYCVEESLAIELDGQVHRNEDAEVYDLNRTAPCVNLPTVFLCFVDRYSQDSKAS